MGGKVSTPGAFESYNPLSWQISPHISTLVDIYRHHNYDYGVDRTSFKELIQVAIASPRLDQSKTRVSCQGFVFAS